jgi:hypothetical protein
MWSKWFSATTSSKAGEVVVILDLFYRAARHGLDFFRRQGCSFPYRL